MIQTKTVLAAAALAGGLYATTVGAQTTTTTTTSAADDAWQRGRASSYSWIPYTSYGYFGINLGQAKYDTPTVPGFDNDDTSNFAGKVYTGGLFSRVLGVEVGYVNMGNVDLNGGRQRAHGANVSLVGNLPLTDIFNVFAKVGTTYGWTRTTASAPGIATGSDNGFGLTFGAGLGFDVTRKIQLLAEWDRQEFKFTTGRDPVDLYTVGVKAKF